MTITIIENLRERSSFIIGVGLKRNGGVTE